MNITQTVVEVDTNKVGTICEIRETTEGKSYLVDFHGVQTWRKENELRVYLTGSTKVDGDFLVD